MYTFVTIIKTVLAILDDFRFGLKAIYVLCFREQVKSVPDKLDSFLAKKHYLHATDLIVGAGR